MRNSEITGPIVIPKESEFDLLKNELDRSILDYKISPGRDSFDRMFLAYRKIGWPISTSLPLDRTGGI